MSICADLALDISSIVKQRQQNVFANSGAFGGMEYSNFNIDPSLSLFGAGGFGSSSVAFVPPPMTYDMGGFNNFNIGSSMPQQGFGGAGMSNPFATMTPFSMPNTFNAPTDYTTSYPVTMPYPFAMQGQSAMQNQFAMPNQYARSNSYASTNPFSKSASSGNRPRAPHVKHTYSAAKYSNLIEESSKKYNVDPALVNAIVKQESGYNPNVKSWAGARGLMQLMPATAKELGVTNSYDPAQNIDGGTKYIAQLLDRYDGDVVRAVAAYNGGMGNIEEKGVGFCKENRDYVQRVVSDYRSCPVAPKN